MGMLLRTGWDANIVLSRSGTEADGEAPLPDHWTPCPLDTALHGEQGRAHHGEHERPDDGEQERADHARLRVVIATARRHPRAGLARPRVHTPLDAGPDRVALRLPGAASGPGILPGGLEPGVRGSDDALQRGPARVPT